MIQLKGQKVILRDWQFEDIEPFLTWQCGEKEWKKWDAPDIHFAEETSEEIAARLKVQIAEIGYEGPRQRLAIADPQTNKLIGTVNSYWISKEANWLAVSIVIFDSLNWGIGKELEALKMWINYLFKAHPEIVRLDLQTWSGNHRLMKLAEKMGFRMWGRDRNSKMVMGQWFDGIHYGILRSEWTSQLNTGVQLV